MPPKNKIKKVKENVIKKVKKVVDDEVKKVKKVVKNNEEKTIEQKYQKKTQLEHILTRPDSYVGEIKLQTEKHWIYDDQTKNIIKKEIEFSPGLFKIVDEIIVNACDHSKVDKTCDTIKVSFLEDNKISIWNNGTGIPVEIHKEHNIYVPELIFGHLLTSTNYDDTEKRITGGRNGYGAKLTNIFSSFFSVETIDGKLKKKFYQEFTNNMGNKSIPVITNVKSENPRTYTEIIFKPDLEKFGLTNMSEDIIALFKRRVYDIAGILPNLKVYLNDTKLDINNFKKYIDKYKFKSYLKEDNSIEDDILSDIQEIKVKNIVKHIGKARK